MQGIKKYFVSGILSILVMISIIFTLVSCGSKEVIPDPVDATTMKYDGKKITWTAPKNAVKYSLTINSKDFTTADPTCSYTVKSTENEVVVSIQSISSTDNRSEAVQRTFERLETIKQLDFDDEGNLSWDSVDGADQYIVELNGKEHTVSSTDFNEFELGKNNAIRVRPIASDGTKFSDFSSKVTKFYLISPTNIKYDGQYITWNGQSQGRDYEVYIGGTLMDTVSSNKYLYDSGENSFNVSVRQLGDGVNKNVFSSPISEEVEYLYLETIHEIRVNEGKIEWDPIDGATGYKILLNDSKVVETKETNYQLDAGTDVTVKIMPIADTADNYFSSYSESKTVHILEAPKLLWNDAIDLSDGQARNNLHWTKVLGSLSGYSVKLTHTTGSVTKDIDIDDLGPNDNDLLFGYPETGVYTVQIKANADPSTGVYFDSKYSNPIEVIRLAAPRQESDFIVSDPNVLSKGFTINFTSVSGATGYQLYKEGTAVTGQVSKTNSIGVLNVIEKNVIEAQEITYGVQSIGSGLQDYSGNKSVTLSSLISENLTAKVTVLAVPQNISFSGTNASWGSVIGANGYSVSMASTASTNQAMYNFENVESGAYEFKVCAKGNGGATLPSNYSEVYNIIRLESPTNIRVGTSDNENTITWDTVLHAKSYSIYFNGESTPVAVNSSDSIEEYITTTGVTIDLISEANEYDSENNHTYYVTSPHMKQVKQLIKLKEPTFGDKLIEGKYIIWNAPSNVDSNVYTPSYKLYDGNNYAYTGFYQASQFDITTNCNHGADNSVSIQAIGDGINYINSDRSKTASFYYLATPEVRRVGNQYVWNSVSQTRNYSVYIEGELVAQPIPQEQGKAEYSYDVDLAKFPSTNKEYNVEVIANGDGGYRIASSDSCSYKQKVIQATSPEITAQYSEAQYDANGEITITISVPSNYTNGYKFTIGGSTSSEVKELSYTYKPNATGIYDIYAIATGGVFGEDGTLYIASDRTKTITMALLPEVSNITIDRDGRVSWSWTGDSTYRSTYSYTVNYGDGSDSVTGTTSNTGFQATNFTNITTISIQVIAKTGSVNSKVTTYTK